MLQQTTEQAFSVIPVLANIKKMQGRHFVFDELADAETNTLSEGVSNIENVVHSQLEKCNPVGSLLNSPIPSGEATPLPAIPAQSDSHAQPDDEVIKSLAKITTLQYEKVRLETAKKLGFRPTVLDKLVKAACNDESKTDRLPFPEVDPHPEPINPAQLLNEISDTIRKFIVLDVEQAHAAALWVAFTWFIDVAEYAPLAIINAPEKACGKTDLLTVLGRMSYRPLPASNASASALFRAVALWKPTILIDEADTFFRVNTELQGMVNAGHLRNGCVLRTETVGDSFEPKTFPVFSAKAVAGIALEKHLSDATMSRGIVFKLRRKLAHEKVSRLRHDNSALFAGIAEKLARFATDYSQRVRQARPALLDALSNRAQDNWEPLLAIAECAGDEWLVRATMAAIKLSGAGDKAVSISNELLADIQCVFKNKSVNKISTVDLIAALIADDEKSWATFNNGNPISSKQIAKLLVGYEIASKNVSFGLSKQSKGFELSQFSDAFVRYLSPPSKTAVLPSFTPEAPSLLGFSTDGRFATRNSPK